MSRLQRGIRLILFSFWTVLVTSLTYILGAANLKVLRRDLGRIGYWSLAILVSTAIYLLQAKFLAVAFFSLAVLMGFFEEFEEMGFSLGNSIFFTVLLNTLMNVGIFSVWVYFQGPNWSRVLLDFIETTLKPVQDINPKLQINYNDIAMQLPSITLILWIIAIYVGVFMEKMTMERLGGGFGQTAPLPKSSFRPELIKFRLPDIWIWVLILSLLGAFGGFQTPFVETISINAMNVCLVLYFFQGIGVVASFFSSLRMSALWQTVFMVMIVVQLFLFVSLLGVMDYWLNFRSRIAKRTEQINRET